MALMEALEEVLLLSIPRHQHMVRLIRQLFRRKDIEAG
jgi:hypothetical protein